MPPPVPAELFVMVQSVTVITNWLWMPPPSPEELPSIVLLVTVKMPVLIIPPLPHPLKVVLDDAVGNGERPVVGDAAAVIGRDQAARDGQPADGGGCRAVDLENSNDMVAADGQGQAFSPGPWITSGQGCSLSSSVLVRVIVRGEEELKTVGSNLITLPEDWYWRWPG